MPLYVEDDAKRAELQKEAAGLPSILISSAAAGNAVMLAGGYFTPLTGYMNVADAMSVAQNMKNHRRSILADPGSQYGGRCLCN